MKLTQLPIILGSILCLAIVGGYGYLIFQNYRVADPLPVPKPTDIITVESLKGKAFTQLSLRETNGPLPIEVNGAEVGKSDPFQ